MLADSPVVARGALGVHVHDLAVALVLEQQALRTVGDDLVVRGAVGGGHVCFPVEIAQVRGLRQQSFLALEHGCEVLGTHPVR